MISWEQDKQAEFALKGRDMNRKAHTGRMQSINFGVALFVVATGLALWAPPKTFAATLEEQLLKHAPEILSKLRERECNRIGVLKFRVQKAGESPSDSTGTLNTFIAERLEVALALANPNDPSKQIKLVHNASAVAANTPQASHLSPLGRETLFSQRYPLAWASEEISVDAFVTGTVQVDEDLRTLRIRVSAAINGEPELTALTRPIIVDTNANLLNELGESFQLRSAPRPDVQAETAADLALQVRQDPAANFPLEHKPTVAFRVYYDGQPVTVTFNETEAIIPEPHAGQRVTMEIERMDQAATVLGVVVKVNGENTLYRQRLRDFDCAKWVLGGEHRKTTIRGFQKENNVASGEAFQVLSKEASRNLEMNYGPDVGTISMVVFQQTHEMPVLSLSEDSPDLIAIAKAQFPAEPPRNADALKAQLRSGEDRGTRGIIVDGSDIQQRIQFVSHHWNPEPLMSVVIRYYRSGN